ncbi:MAG: isochorismatase family protein [Lentimonas sp.]
MSDPINHLGILFIDFQDIFLKLMPTSDVLLKRACFTAEAATLLGCSVALTEQLPEKLGETTQALADALPENTPAYGKSSFSALEAEGIDRWLESNQIDHLLLAGIETSICVYQTAVQGLGQDLGVTLLADCIGERRPEDRQPVLQQLLSMDAHVLPSETIFYSLLSNADHPKFKAYTELVKKYS